MNKIISRKFLLTIGFTATFSIIACTTISCDNGTNYNVTLTSTCLELTEVKNANSKKDFICTFKIKDDVIGDRYMDNIDLNTMAVKVNGNEIPVEGFSFIYQTNEKNQFTIQKEYITGDIEICADLTDRTQKHNCYYFEYDLNSYVNFSDFEVTYPTKQKQGGIEAIHEKTKTVDDIYLNEGFDIAILPKEVALKYLGKEVNLFVVREDNKLEIKLKSKDDNALPANIWFRSNARFTNKGVDFTIDYSSDKKSAIMKIPYFFIRDNGSFRCNPDVEA